MPTQVFKQFQAQFEALKEQFQLASSLGERRELLTKLNDIVRQSKEYVAEQKRHLSKMEAV
jgi:hypothetical protein